MFQRKLQPGCESLHFGFKLSRFKRSQFVEHGEDDEWVDSDHESLDEKDKDPEVVEKIGAKGLNNLQKSGKNGPTQYNDENLVFNDICEELIEEV